MQKRFTVLLPHDAIVLARCCYCKLSVCPSVTLMYRGRIYVPSLQLGTGKTAGWLVGWLAGWWLVSRVRLSALGLAISPERVVRSTSFLACSRGPPGPRMCAVLRTAGVRKHARRCATAPRVYARQASRASAECIMVYVLTVYPAVSWAPRGRAHELS